MEPKLPQFFLEMLEKQYGEQISKEIIEGYMQKRKTTLRANTLKTTTDEVVKKLKEAGIETENIPWSEQALIIKNADEKELEKLKIYEDGKVYFNIKTTVSKGTYIRSLVRDIGLELGVPAVMNSLVRTRLGKFKIDDSYSINDIKNGKFELIPILDAIDNLPRIKVDDRMAFKIRNGVILDKFFDGDKAFILDKDDNLIAIYENVDNKARVYKMFS